MAEFKGILIIGEGADSRLAPIALELLGAGRQLADGLGQELGVLLLGSGVKALAPEAILYGADRVYVVDDPMLREYVGDVYVQAAEKAIKQISPRILLLGQTSLGRDLAPRLAFRLGVGLATDCTELSLDPQTGNLLLTRSVYGGNARAVFISPAFPQMATVRSKVMSPLERDPARKGEVVEIPAQIDPSQVKPRLINRVKEEVKGIKLEEAEVVVSGGRGIGSADGFRQLAELARLFPKGSVGATRAVIDNGWWPASEQVGLTGKIVTPNLYIAVALSGASQHMAGCSGSKTIVAINKDAEANIFKEARYGVVGDYRQILPAFKEKLKELLAG